MLPGRAEPPSRPPRLLFTFPCANPGLAKDIGGRLLDEFHLYLAVLCFLCMGCCLVGI